MLVVILIYRKGQGIVQTVVFGRGLVCWISGMDELFYNFHLSFQHVLLASRKQWFVEVWRKEQRVSNDWFHSFVVIGEWTMTLPSWWLSWSSCLQSWCWSLYCVNMSPSLEIFASGSHIASSIGYPFHLMKYWYPFPLLQCFTIVSTSYTSCSSRSLGEGLV